MDLATCDARISDLVLGMTNEASDSISLFFFSPSFLEVSFSLV